MTYAILDPRQGPKSGLVDPAPRLASLRGLRLGILWNNRPRGDALLRNVAAVLDKQYGLREVYFTRKPFIGNAAPEDVLDDLVSRVDAAIVGVGD